MKTLSFLPLFLLFATIPFISNAQQNLTFVIDNPPTEMCDGKENWFKMKDNPDFPCDLKKVEWFVKDFNTSSWGGSRHQGKLFNYYLNVGTNHRTIQLKAEMQCVVDTGEEDEEGNPIFENRTFSDVITVKVVHPDFFQLRASSDVDCNTENLTFTLQDPSGTLSASNLDNISWTVPSDWTTVSGGGSTHTITVNTNGNAEGKRKVKVKYEAIATKVTNGIPEKKKCHSSKEITADIDISACRSTISYPPSVPNHPSSHSGVSTTFGATTFSPQDYNFAAGEFHELTDGFDAKAESEKRFHLFIEECGCSSPWHDPNLKGPSTLSIDNPEIFASNKTNHNAVGGETDELGEAFDLSKVGLYPNPFERAINIVNLKPDSQVDLSVRTLDAKEIIRETRKVEGSGNIELDLSTLNAGMYVLILQSEEKTHIVKIIKK